MANPPQLRVSGLPDIGAKEKAATTSPARGAEMLNFLQTRLHQKNRAPPLVHTWDFWHDRQDHSTNPTDSASTSDIYEARLEHLAQMSDVKQFWNVFNNFDIMQLKLRDSVHLFHKGVKPVWEDSRNARGGSWTFRVPKSQASAFWQEVCLMAIGEQLQSAVEEPGRATFRDDICGVSLGVRFNSMLVQIWNRDGDHEAGTERIAKTVLEGLSEELKPREGCYYYKKHNEHAGFGGRTDSSRPISSDSPGGQDCIASGVDAVQSIDGVVKGA
ncbi:hypothetical protein DOTSEDRAFT_69325 [Dothistroma septosporum NZE10]|uniref:Translation initiation factor eIF4e n=1 Tax=Dothistroma septosporum (strain NZE10 / CBS 128990) TaxID=675120 RepID=N1PWI6_DOTSN|nr:hypothetical protein DOTSEDRAFT_69325 [Dothistroma septosporum NZE10]